VLRRIIRNIVIHRVASLVVFVLLVATAVGAVAASALGYLPGGRVQSVGVGVPAVPAVSVPLAGGSAAGTPPPATEAFLKGTETYNAELIWNSFSQDALERMKARGVSLDVYQRQLTQAKEMGRRVEDVTYVGGHRLPTGASMHFYIVTQRVGDGDPQYVSYVFTLDKDGKISRVQ